MLGAAVTAAVAPMVATLALTRRAVRFKHVLGACRDDFLLGNA